MTKSSERRSDWPRRFFSPEEMDIVLSAIVAAELRTSGEVRVHLEARVPIGRTLRRDPYRRARRVFAKLGMHRTESRNAVLFYLATRTRRFAVVGDEKLHDLVGDEFWRDISAGMKAEFGAGRYAEGLADGIRRVGERLRVHFPYQDDDVNELPDEISY